MPSGIHYFPDEIDGRIGPISSARSLNMGFVSHQFTAVAADPWCVVTSNPDTSTRQRAPLVWEFPTTWLGTGNRMTFITVTDIVDGTYNGYLIVGQGGCATYSLDRYNETVSYSGISTDPLYVKMDQGPGNHEAPASWVAAIDVPWITVTPTSGNYAAGTGSPTGPHTQIIHFDVALNPTTSPRVGHITIKGAFPCGPDPVFTVNQEAGPGGGGGGGGPFDGTGYQNPFNLPEAWGYYLRAGIATTGIGGAGNAVCLRANKVAPYGGFDQVGVISSAGTAVDPRLAYLPDVRRLLAVYRYSGDVYTARSDDDGHTWGGNVILIAGGKHPTIAAGIDGTLIVAAYVAPTGGATYGTIKVTVQGPGDSAFGTPFTLKDQAGTDVPVLDDSFHLCQPPNGARLWVWALMVGGDTGCSEWQSGEPGSETVTRVV